MSARPLPARDKLTICFAHVAYRMGDRFALRNTGLDWFEVRSLEDLRARIKDVDVLLCSGLWRNDLIPAAPRLAFIQWISAGTDQYFRDGLRAAGIRVASAQGANERAVAEHAIALILAMTRQIPQARDNQTARTWRGMVGDISKREDELGGKTLVIAGMGRIGSRLATLAKAFDMRVIAFALIRRRARGGRRVVGADRLVGHCRADCRADLPAHGRDREPDRREGARCDEALGPSHQRRARKVVNEPSLVEALKQNAPGAALDCGTSRCPPIGAGACPTC
jgi:phosphoglycerate dehydrogenase-like enzyme